MNDKFRVDMDRVKWILATTWSVGKWILSQYNLIKTKFMNRSQGVSQIAIVMMEFGYFIYQAYIGRPTKSADKRRYDIFCIEVEKPTEIHSNIIFQVIWI